MAEAELNIESKYSSTGWQFRSCYNKYSVYNVIYLVVTIFSESIIRLLFSCPTLESAIASYDREPKIYLTMMLSLRRINVVQLIINVNDVKMQGPLRSLPP